MHKFELPLNERIRRLISLENVFTRLNNQINNMNAFSEFSCFQSYFHMHAVASRADIKIEIVQELDKLITKKKLLSKTKKNLEQIKKLVTAKKDLDKLNVTQGNFFGNDKFLQEIKTASISPSGIVSSDLPRLQLWIQSNSPKTKQNYFIKKIEPYIPIFNSLKTYLEIIRDTIKFESLSSLENGLVSYQLDPAAKHDLIQIQTPQKLNLFPNLTSNKYTINIQFNSTNKAIKLKKPIKFKIGVSHQ